MFSNFRNHVYMGESHFKPRKNHLDKMMDNIMHSTGLTHILLWGTRMVPFIMYSDSNYYSGVQGK